MATFNRTLVDTRHSTDVVPATHVARDECHVLHSSVLANGPEESAIAAACYGFFRLECGDDVTATVEGALECRAVGGTNRQPGLSHEVVGNEVVGQTDVGLGATVVHIVGYPIEVAEIADDIYAVAGASEGLHSRLLIGMETALAAADAILVVVMTFAGLLEVCPMVALLAGVFHDDGFAVTVLFRTHITVLMAEFLKESAITVNHVIKIVHGNLLLAEINMIGLDDKIANETTLVVTAPVGRIACPFVGFRNNLSAVKTFLVVFFCAQLVGLGKLHPGVDAVVELGEAVWLLLGESALVAVTITNMGGDVSIRSGIGNLLLEFGLMAMPGKDEVASAAGMPAAVGFI